MKKAIYTLGAIAMLTLVAFAMVWWRAPHLLPDAAWWAGTSTSPEKLPAREDTSPESGGSRATDEGSQRPDGPYEPTSAYVADGFDPDERLLDFSKAKARSGSGSVREVLTADDVQRIVYDRANQLVPCYQKVLDERPEARGTVHFAFAIASGGDVRMVRVTDSELRSQRAEDCMVRKAREWTFPETNLDFVTRFQTSMLFRLR